MGFPLKLAHIETGPAVQRLGGVCESGATSPGRGKPPAFRAAWIVARSNEGGRERIGEGGRERGRGERESSNKEGEEDLFFKAP